MPYVCPGFRELTLFFFSEKSVSRGGEEGGRGVDYHVHARGIFLWVSCAPQSLCKPNQEPCWKDMGVSQNWGYLFGGLYNKDYSILGSILGYLNFGKLPHGLIDSIHSPWAGPIEL